MIGRGALTLARSTPELLPCGLLFAVNAVYIATSATRTASPHLVDAPIALLVPIALLACTRAAPVSRATVAWAVVAMALLAWEAAVNAWNPWNPGHAWGVWLLHAVATAAALAVAARARPATGLHVLGMATAAALALALLTAPAMHLFSGRPLFQCLIYGFNQINQFAMLVPPALLAWLWWAWHEGRRPRWQWAVVASAVVYAFVVIVMSHRRASFIAVPAMLLAPIAWACARRFPRLAATTAILGALLACGVLLNLARLDQPLAPTPADAGIGERMAHRAAGIDPNRVPLYRLAMHAADRSFPLGMGYAALAAVGGPDNEDARLKHNQEYWQTLEAHNEFLQRLAEAGPLALALFVALAAIAAVAVVRCPDRGVGGALAILGAGGLTSLAFHGIYQHALPMVWTGVIAGLALATTRPLPPSADARGGRVAVAGAWILATACALYAPVAAWSATVRAESSLTALRRAVAMEALPFALDTHARTLLARLVEQGAAVDHAEVVAATERRLGPHLLQPERRAIAVVSDDAAGLEEWLRWHPCDVDGYLLLPADHQPRDQRLARRLSWLRGAVPPDDLPVRPRDLDALADVLVAGTVRRDPGAAAWLRPRLAEIAACWPTVEDANWMVLALLARHPDAAGPWLAGWPVERYLTGRSRIDTVRVLDAFRTPEQLAAIAPLLLRPGFAHLDQPLRPAEARRASSAPGGAALARAWRDLRARCRALPPSR